MLLLLADEHIPNVSVQLLREAGHDLVCVGIDFQSIADIDIIALANKEHRIIVTCDSDFGELIFKRGVRCNTGVIYFRIKRFEPDEPANIILYRLNEMKTAFEGAFTVLTRKTIRQRNL
jgi:predicted nuclease of predicted toxin-antitoxin system